MVRRSIRVCAAAVLVVGLVALSASSRAADDDEVKAAKKAAEAVKKLAGSLDTLEAKEIADQAKKVAKENDIEYVMHQFKPSTKGGKDSIELAIIELSKTGPNPAALKGNKDDLLKIARVSRTIAEINYNYPPPKKPKAIPANWKQYTDEMKASSKDLDAAIKAGNAANVKSAATKLTASCNSCHTMFRD